MSPSLARPLAYLLLWVRGSISAEFDDLQAGLLEDLATKMLSSCWLCCVIFFASDVPDMPIYDTF